MRSSHSRLSVDGPLRPVEILLRTAGLRPTRQRISLASILFAKGNRHLTAEMLHQEAAATGVFVSLATIYNILHELADAGLLRHVAVERAAKYFDTNTSHHHHFLAEDGTLVRDIPDADLVVAGMPVPPDGYEIFRIDVVIRLSVKNLA